MQKRVSGYVELLNLIHQTGTNNIYLTNEKLSAQEAIYRAQKQLQAESI